MSVETRITDSFPITTGTGDIYRIIEYTEYAIIPLRGQTLEDPGRRYYKTEDGLGVNNLGKGLFEIPTLGVTGVDNKAVP